MAYWVKAYCTADTIPTIGTFVAWLRAEHGTNAEARVGEPSELHAADWTEFELVYDPEKRPIAVECNRDTEADSLCAGEVRGELESLEDPRDSEPSSPAGGGVRQNRFVCPTRRGEGIASSPARRAGADHEFSERA